MFTEEEIKAQLLHELLLVSRMYANMPVNSIDEMVCFGIPKQMFIDNIYKRMYDKISQPTNVLLDRLLNTMYPDTVTNGECN